MDRYVYVSSDESDSYFPENEVYKFKVHLESPLFLTGFWKVGLVEFRAKQSKSKLIKTNGPLYIFTDLCKESIVNGVQQPLLRRLEKNVKDGWSHLLDPVIYLPVKRKELLEFEVYIKNEDESLPSFLQSPLHLTLHFKRYPFYADYEAI